MTRMRAIDAAVLVLEREGITCAFGVPGAAINPMYSAMLGRGTIRHYLGRHVEAAVHMAEGYSRATAGNIGLCLVTSGPGGTDTITGLYSAWADSVPLLVVSGQAPVAKLHKEDFQAVDIAAIAAPVTKWAETVMEPAQVPGAFQRAFHVMRSGGPGPVLLDLPIDVQLAEIDFDIDTYEPLPVVRPAATRAQAEKVLDLLQAASRPLIVAGGGIVNAAASDLLVELAGAARRPVVPTLMGWGTDPDDHELMAGMAGLQTAHRYGNATVLASTRARHRQPLGQPAHRRAGRLPRRSHLRAQSTSSPPRSAASSPRTTASSPTPARRWSGCSRWRASGPPPAPCRTAGAGSPTASSASARCTAAPTSRTSRSSRSGSTRR
jgi:tartronate-semialdehyde synthase